jgi:hypothetical protein
MCCPLLLVPTSCSELAALFKGLGRVKDVPDSMAPVLPLVYFNAMGSDMVSERALRWHAWLHTRQHLAGAQNRAGNSQLLHCHWSWLSPVSAQLAAL